jgi:hypothetical protein
MKFEGNSAVKYGLKNNKKITCQTSTDSHPFGANSL